MTETPRVLVIQTAFLGDVVLTTPLLRAVKDRWPASHLAALVIPETAAVLEGLPFLDEIIVHDKRGRGLRELARVLREVRARRFDVVISPHRSARSSLIAWHSGAATRLGYDKSALPFLYTARVPRGAAGHETERILALGAKIGIIGVGGRPCLAVRPEERVAARRTAGRGPFVVLSPSSVWATKRWTPEGFAAVGDNLAGQGYGVILVGTAADRAITGAVAGAMAAPVRDLAGETTVRELAALIAEAALVVANDSAPVHVAAAFDTPTVAIFGATVPGQGFGPLASRAAVAEVTGITCRPCGPHGGAHCPKKHFRCMRDLPPADVNAATAKVLAKTPPRKEV